MTTTALPAAVALRPNLIKLFSAVGALAQQDLQPPGLQTPDPGWIQQRDPV